MYCCSTHRGSVGAHERDGKDVLKRARGVGGREHADVALDELRKVQLGSVRSAAAPARGH